MKRQVQDMSTETDSDFEFTPPFLNPRNDFALARSLTRMQPGNSTNHHNTNEPPFTSVYELARPIWPANDAVTPAISEKRIRELECGNDNEKLMAAFARHVINPGRNRRPGTRWVSHRSLRKAFAEHFDQTGFLAESAWKDKTAGDFGLPDLFFRTVDDGKAYLRPDESVDDLVADLGQAPALQPLTAEEYEQLRNRVLVPQHSASMTTDQPQSFDTSSQNGQGLQDEGEGDLNTIQDESNTSRPFKRLQSMSRQKSQLGEKTEVHSVLGSGWVTPDRISPPSTKPRVSPGIEQKPFQQQQTDFPDNEAKSNLPNSSSPAVNDMRAIKEILVPQICDILKDFPTAPEDESFLPLLRQLLKATVANTPQSTEEKHLDLLTHVVTNCTSSSPTDQVDIASLVRPVLKILSRHRQKLAVQTHSQIQRDINAAARANDLGSLRALHAELLLFEAQHGEKSECRVVSYINIMAEGSPAWECIRKRRTSLAS